MFCTANNEPVDASGTVPLSVLIEYFIIYLVTEKSEIKKKLIAPTTANQYISHVTKFLLDNQFILHRSEVRSDRSADIIKGLSNVHSSSLVPLRLRCKIPVTYSIMLAALRQAEILFGHNPALLKAIKAAIALGYALSLRPQEYLDTGTPIPLWKQAHSSMCFFWFSEDLTPYNVCFPDAYPPNLTPTDFTMFLDFNKNHQTGDAGPRSMSAAPTTSSICCVRLLFEFLRLYPPHPNSALLSGGTTPVTTYLIRQVFTATAIFLKLDPKRLVPHSLRCAALVQMLAFDKFTDVDYMQQGRWKTLQGLRPYAHVSLSHSRKLSSALYDADALPLHMSQLTFSNHS